jgi:hypothetical protein
VKRCVDGKMDGKGGSRKVFIDVLAAIPVDSSGRCVL